MTDTEIIKALERCVNTEFISDCAKCEMCAFDCKDILIENALDLINRTKLESKRYRGKCSGQKVELTRLYEQVRSLKAEIERLKEALKDLKREMSYMSNPYTLGDRHEMGCW